jgi:hypothetical protein
LSWHEVKYVKKLKFTNITKMLTMIEINPPLMDA